jgi:voltage-gated potassium channel
MTSLTRFVVSILLVFLLVLSGTAGYTLLEDMHLREALYMTVITLATVGFREVKPLSPEGQWFTIGLIVFGVTFAGYAVASITAFFVEGELKDLMKGRRMQRQIERLKEHYILCGCGEVGREIVLEFKRVGVPFVVIEKAPEHSELVRDTSILFIQGDATEEDILRQAGIERAKGLISALRDDTDNVFVTLTARQLNPTLLIVARVGERGNENKLLRAGADRVISPYRIAGHRMASLILRPTVVDFLDIIVHEDGVDLRLEEVRLPPGSPLIGKTTEGSNIRKETGAVIVSVHGSDGKPRVLPPSNVSLSGLTLQEGDILIALGSEDQIARLKLVVQG